MFGVGLVVPLWERIQVYEPKAFRSAGKCFLAAPCRELIYLHKYKISVSALFASIFYWTAWLCYTSFPRSLNSHIETVHNFRSLEHGSQSPLVVEGKI